MDRFKFSLQSAVLALSLLMSATAMAGTVFAPPAARDSDAANGEYPESRFGAPPANGISQGFAARQVIDMDSPDEESGRAPGASRGIASIGESPVVTTQAAARDIPASVVARRGVQEVSVIASDLGYFPKTIFVSRNVPVRMYVTSASKNTLCIMMDSFQVRKQVKSDKIEEITFVPNVPGNYRFYCPVNGMEGNLVVKEFSTPFQYSAEGASEAPVAAGSTRRLAGDSGP